MIYRIMALMVKEILAVLKDKKARIVLIIPPFVQLFIFSFAATLDVKNVPIGILNLDNGEKSTELIQRFIGSPAFSNIVFLQSEDQVAPFINMRKGVLVVSIDQKFSKSLDTGKPADIQLILDGRKSNTAQIVAGYIARIIERYNADLGKSLQVQMQPTEIVSRYWYNPNLIYTWYNVPSLVAILTMLVGLVITALSVAREREMGTFDQLLVSPVRPIEIMIGKALPAIIIAIVEGTIIVLAAIFVFQIPFTGSLLLLYVSLTVFVSAIVGVGLFLSSLAMTQQQAILGTFVFMSPSVLLSGFATPIENMPDWLQYFTYANPLRYMLVISKGLFLKEMPFYVVVQNIWPMAVIASLTLTGATLFFRRRIS